MRRFLQKNGTKRICASAILIMTSIASGQSASGEITMPNIKLKMVNPESLYDPTPYGYSHVVEVEHSHKVAYIAGQGGEDHAGILKPDFETQVKQAYKNLSTALNAIDATPRHVARITTYVVDYDMSRLEVMTSELKNAFSGWLPAQTLVPVPRLAVDGMLFEIDAVVVFSEE